MEGGKKERGAVVPGGERVKQRREREEEEKKKMRTKQGPGEPGGWPRRKGVDHEQPRLPWTLPSLKQPKFPNQAPDVRQPVNE